VLTGLFPEVGGGSGLSLGKDRTKAMVESFGGRVTGSISGKTDILLVGQEPGYSKVSEARKRPKITLVSLVDLERVLKGQKVIEDAAPVVVNNFSAGYEIRGQSNSLALTASAAELRVAQGLAPPPELIGAAKTAKTAKKDAKSKGGGSGVPAGTSSGAAAAAAPAAAAPTSSASRGDLVVQKETTTKPAFRVPVPGVDGAIADALAGKTVVMTGVFPEVGGGTGLSLGKDRTKAMVESFGARVTGSVSGKTDILLVGQEPGYGAVSAARTRPKITFVSLVDLERVLKGTIAIEQAAPVIIDTFSAGYLVQGRSNSLALTASAAELRVARGLDPPPKLVGEVPAAKGAAPTEAAATTAARKAGGTKRKKDAAPSPEETEEEDAPIIKAATTKKPATKKKKTTTKDAPPPEPVAETAVVVSRSGRAARAPAKYTPQRYAT